MRPHAVLWFLSAIAFTLQSCTPDEQTTEPNTSASQSPGQYRAVDLGTLGGAWSSAGDVSPAGQVVGASDIQACPPCPSHAFLWDNGEMKDLGTLAGTGNSGAAAINSAGQVVGWSETGKGGSHAVLWEGGHIVDLGTLGGSISEAVGINPRGQVVGWSETAGGATHGFLWEKGIMTDLGTFGDPVYPADINPAGRIVGTVLGPGNSFAFLWNKGTVMNLGTLDGIQRATAINPRGQVVGWSQSEDASGELVEVHSFLWTKGRVLELESLGGARTYATDINEAGQVVGRSSTASLEEHAVLWDNGRIFDLGSLGGGYAEALGINAAGQIVGASLTANGEFHAAIWIRK